MTLGEMMRTLALLLTFLVASAGALGGETLERTALLILPEEVGPRSPFRAWVQLRWEDDAPLWVTTWTLKEGESTLGDIQVFDEQGREVRMIFPVTLPLIPNGERLVKKGEVLKLGLYLMGWPFFDREGGYYAVATFTHAFSKGQNVRFTTKKCWFKVAGRKGRHD